MNPLLVKIVLTMLAVLATGTLVRMVALRSASAELTRTRISSVKTWWMIALLISMAVIGGRSWTALVIVFAGVLGQREFLRLVGVAQMGRVTLTIIWILTAFWGICLILGYDSFLRAAAPLSFLLILGMTRPLLGQTSGYMVSTAVPIWSLLLFVYLLPHSVFLFQLPPGTQPAAGPAGSFLFLVILTETNDISQALVGRRFGRIRITPRVSPNKSLEGLLGGVVVTILLAVILAPTLTTLAGSPTRWVQIAWPAAAGLIISVAGFLGDINMSAVKRDAGVKDGSRLLPGHGGMIDRIDSLIFTSPVFWYFVELHAAWAGPTTGTV